MATLLWPSISWTTFGWTPWDSSSDAQVCLSVWNVARRR
jgi:hypothetical protein